MIHAASNRRADYAIAMDVVVDYADLARSIVPRRFDLDDAPRAFETAAGKSTRSIKVQIGPGGGGLDLGFERAGFDHVASFDVMGVCGSTLRRNRPQWRVFAGADGDVTGVDWQPFAGKVDIVHGGPPCQPFSVAGLRQGDQDDRDMWPEFTRAVLDLRPAAFVAENVPGMLDRRFRGYVETAIMRPLRGKYDPSI